MAYRADATFRLDLRELNELNFARFDAKLEQRLAEVRAELRTELRTELGAVRQDLREGLANLRSELIKWTFVFFVTAAIAVIGLR